MDRDDKMRLVESANEHRARIRSMSPTRAMLYVEEILAESDVVYGVWSDPSEDDGVGTWLVKGRSLLRDIEVRKTAATVRTSAVPCDCLEQAAALQRTLGDRLD
jgi:hypothetical protein